MIIQMAKHALISTVGLIIGAALLSAALSVARTESVPGVSLILFPVSGLMIGAALTQLIIMFLSLRRPRGRYRASRIPKKIRVRA